MEGKVMLSARQISLSNILYDIELILNAGEFVGIIGPNGAGKTTLMRSLMHMDNRAQGVCNLWDLSDKSRARQAGWLAQERNVSWDLTAKDVVELGRIPWRGFAGRAHREDISCVQNAIERLSLKGFEERIFGELSGGERARVLLARLLAQNTQLMLADEPIAALDPRYQLEIMSLFRTLADEGHCVMISIHDLSLAMRFCTRIILLHEGKIIDDGAAQHVLSDANIAKVFGIKVHRAAADMIQPIGVLK